MIAPGSFPTYRSGKPPQRTVALLQRAGGIVTEDGEDLPEPAAWGQLASVLGDRELLLLSARPLLREPWLLDAVADPTVDIMVNPAGSVSAVRYRVLSRGHWRAYWVVPASAWLSDERSGPPDGHAGPMLLGAIREAAEAVGGLWGPTPAALGIAALRQHFPRMPPLYRPPLWHWQHIHDSIAGGRADLAAKVRGLSTAWETDANGAYLAAALSVPGGTTYRHVGAAPQGAVASYSLYAMRVPGPPLPLGPVHVRTASGLLDYPTQGSWKGWYWDFEADVARECGIQTQELYGVHWTRMHDGLAPGLRQLYQLRQGATLHASRILKLAGVAGLGRMGMDRTITTLHQQPQGPADYAIGDARDWVDLDLWAHQEQPQREREGLLVHVASFVHAKVRVKLFVTALPFAIDGSLLSTNFDALYTRDKPDITPDETLGGWKVKQLHNVSIPHPRWILSDEKVRTPGRAS